jgi:hypothetical protein
MGITISHASALHKTRKLRALGMDLQSMDFSTIAHPAPWLGAKWSAREFTYEEWKWGVPSSAAPLHVVVAKQSERLRAKNLKCHVCSAELPANAILWLDGLASMSSPPLLFVQMAETLSLPELVMLGYELCGNYTRSADNPLYGPVTDQISAATSVSEVQRFLEAIDFVPGIPKAQEALKYIADHAFSVPEAVLATMYSLPPKESGYGMGPVTLNQRVKLGDETAGEVNARYPDLMFPFGPLGLNYDGQGHLDLYGLERAANRMALAVGKDVEAAETALVLKREEIRMKVIDDIRRNRQIMSTGRIVFPVTKEDLREVGGLDNVTRDILRCAHNAFGIDTSSYEKTLNDNELSRERRALLDALLPFKEPISVCTLKSSN